ncbi:nuclear transport factor 2 family protein [Actinomycetospora aeridis]|uniref:Nuclear transport factor 2 family protein n=1 Tax=Actinomycetospora aeridis TaxID=3129231 RepID=A0ABU8N6B0_9PSEU
MTPDDRVAITDVLALYCERIDSYDMDAVVDLFTTDAVMDFGPGRGGALRGREALRARFAGGQAGFRRTHHHLGQVRLTDAGDGRVHALSSCSAGHELHDGTQWRVGLRYVDVLVREDRWRIAERRIEAALVEGGPRDGWTWIGRKDPETA